MCHRGMQSLVTMRNNQTLLDKVLLLFWGPYLTHTFCSHHSDVVLATTSNMSLRSRCKPSLSGMEWGGWALSVWLSEGKRVDSFLTNVTAGHTFLYIYSDMFTYLPSLKSVGRVSIQNREHNFFWVK